MSEENIAVIRDLWDAYACGDFERVLEFCDPHVVMITLEEGPLYGVDAARRNHERWKEAWKETEITLEKVVDAGDHVFLTACFRARGRGSGVEVRARLYEVYTMRNRKILRVDEFGEKAHALEAAGLRE
jgi:ketosteroid isomerase-like protein